MGTGKSSRLMLVIPATILRSPWNNGELATEVACGCVPVPDGNMRRLIEILLGLSLTLTSLAAAEHRTIPAEVFWESGFPWLASEDGAEGEPFEIPVYQISCASCLESFAAILDGEEDPSPLFFLNTAKLPDREIAHALIATVLAQSEEAEQRRVFRYLLGAYMAAPELYLNDPAQWRETCLEAWGDGPVAPADPRPWAQALNGLHGHNGLLGWLDVYQTPAWLSMAEESRRVLADDELDEAGRQFRMLMVTEPSLQPDLAGEPVRVHSIRFNPGFAMDAEKWTELVTQIEEGALWLWVENRATDSKLIQQWRAGLEALPDLSSRREYFLKTFRAVAEWQKKGKWSLLDALKRGAGD